MWLLPLALAALPMKVVAPTFSTAGVPEDKVHYFTVHFATKLRAQGVEVITSEEIGTLLGVERQRELLGCTGESSECLTELSNALGTNATARGSVALIGGQYRVSITVLSNAGKVLGEYSSPGTDEGGVLEALTDAAAQLAVALGVRPAPVAVAVEKPSRLRARAVVPFVVGVVVAAAGVVLLAEAGVAYGQLSGSMQFAPGEGQSLAARGSVFNALGWVGLGLGVASMALGAVLFALDGSAAQPAVALVPGGAVLGVRGAFW